MADSFEKFINKPRLLIVDDDPINREMLALFLEDEWRFDFAVDGMEAIEKINTNKDYGLILLDIVMPNVDGFGVIENMRSNGLLEEIPIIVLTSEKEYEVSCLELGAADFIKKPFEAAPVVKARVKRVYELFHTRKIVDMVKEDQLTHLYTKTYFETMAGMLRDSLDDPSKMDMVELDVVDFHFVNELFGRGKGDELLREIGAQVLEILKEGDGLACREDADHFFLYLKKREDYRVWPAKFSDSLAKAGFPDIHIRLGITDDDGSGLSIEDLMMRAKSAHDSIGDDFTQSVSFYDDLLRKKELLHNRLILDFESALKKGEFRIYVQPKYNVTGEKPVLEGGEALIRWIHPELGFISPGEFIPLFEKNGLIRKLDRFVFEEAVKVIKRAYELLGRYLPISMNVSRVDVRDPDLGTFLLSLAKNYGIDQTAMHLEVTESAFAANGTKLNETVASLRNEGFIVEMDDFGAGYSSLNMLSDLPFDILKLDMGFARNMEKSEVNAAIVKLIIDIAKYLKAQVIAEGVETESQVNALRSYGCDLIQGYYFSKPLPIDDFFALLKKEFKL